MAICSPSLSLCGIIISVWGIIQLALMGLFFHMNSLALSEDIPGLDRRFDEYSEFESAANHAYARTALNCWVAALLYVITLLVSAHQFYLNSRNSVSM